MVRMTGLNRCYSFLLSVLLVLPTISMAATTIESYKNTQVKKISPVLDNFLYKTLKEYPYLYVHQEETDYNKIFEKDPNAFVILAKKDGSVIGELQANPLDSPYFEKREYSPQKSLAQIKKQGFYPEKILYVSTFMMAKDERANLSVIKQMYEKTVNFAKSIGKSQICYMDIIEAENHPLRPNTYVSVEPWKVLGKKIKNMDVKTTMSWPTLQADGKVKDEEHILAFYVIDIN